MAKYVHERPDSSQFQFVPRVPEDLLHRYPKSPIRYSLRTADPALAAKRGVCLTPAQLDTLALEKAKELGSLKHDDAQDDFQDKLHTWARTQGFEDVRPCTRPCRTAGGDRSPGRWTTCRPLARTRRRIDVAIDRRAGINCTGPAADLARARGSLLARLRDDGLLGADALGQGSCVDAALRPVGANGLATDGLYDVRPMLKAEHWDWEATAVPGLRAHARDVARTIVAAIDREPIADAHG